MSPIVQISDAEAARFSLDTIRARHQFAETGLFTDDALAELIDGYPLEYIDINTTTPNADGTMEWRHGSIAGHSAAEVLQAIRQGHLWINLQHMEEVAPRYHVLVQRAFAEIADRNPQFKTFRHNTGILISSPSARVLYHCDIPPIALWHIRGRKRLYLYPDSEEFLADIDRERVVLKETEEEIPYWDSFDAYAQVFDLEPGDALSWKMQQPHRVENLDGLNVSITTSYFTPAARKFYGVIYANGAMRRLFGISPQSHAAIGPVALVKCALAAGIRASGVLKAHERVFETTFEVDPTNERGYHDLAGGRA